MKNKFLTNYYYIAILIFASFYFQSCTNDDGDDNLTDSNGYTKTVIPSNIKDLYQAIGPETSETIIVYSHGGPSEKLETEDIEETQFNNYYRVYVKQAQHINPTINANEITFDQAIEEGTISSEIFYKVLRHFKTEGKTVIAMSHSLGSFIIPNVLATKPNIADKVVLMAGRLDIPDIVWKGFRDGNLYSFSNGITPIKNDMPSLTGSELSFTRLQAGLGKNRYTQLLDKKDLKNVIYIYGEKDEAVGALTNQEIEFLKNKGATSILIEEGDHGSMFQPNNLDNILTEIHK
ncbi:hypothetical protein ABW636_16055 [Aquimarina sp. 2201CG1-2-11]|uniref:hypothetical protein n=1 Tax=Aquimarina discodermiae TaxID=3231043 RepID=UPI0034632BE0